jgi:hypothetical protein
LGLANNEYFELYDLEVIMHARLSLWLLCFGTLMHVVCGIGCSSRPGRIATPDVDSEEIAQSALEMYDEDADGMLNSEELKASPPLVNAVSVYDTDKDGSLSQAELVVGIGSWAEARAGAFPLAFLVKMDGRPLAGAQVMLIAAPFLGDAVKGASGVSDDSGGGSFNMADEDRPANAPKNLPVIQPGLYLVEITHPTIAIPEVYNKASTLGLEAGIAGQNPSGVVWELSSKKK